MAEYKKGEIAHIGNPIIMNGDSNLESKNDDDACYRRLKLKMHDPFIVTAVHPRKGKGKMTTYDGIYERDGIQYRIYDLPEFNLWQKKGWELFETLHAEKESLKAEIESLKMEVSE